MQEIYVLNTQKAWRIIIACGRVARNLIYNGEYNIEKATAVL